MSYVSNVCQIFRKQQKTHAYAVVCHFDEEYLLLKSPYSDAKGVDV